MKLNHRYFMFTGLCPLIGVIMHRKNLGLKWFISSFSVLAVLVIGCIIGDQMITSSNLSFSIKSFLNTILFLGAAFVDFVTVAAIRNILNKEYWTTVEYSKREFNGIITMIILSIIISIIIKLF